MKRFGLFRALCAAAAVVAIFAAEAGAHLAYTWSSYPDAGGAGVIEDESKVIPYIMANMGSDLYVFSFRDHEGEWRLLYADESTMSSDDSVYIYDPADFVTPLRNAAKWGTSTHGVTSDSAYGYLYLMTYATNNNNGPAGITLVDMPNGYTKVKTAPSPSNPPPYMSYYGEAVAVMNGKVYGLYSCRNGAFSYVRSVVVEYDMSLENSRVIELIDSGDIARNTTSMTVHGDSLYIAAMGGYFGEGKLRGGVWKVTPSGSQEVEKLLDVVDLAEYNEKNYTAGVVGLDVASNGDMYVMTGVLSSQQVEDPILWKTKVSNPQWGNKPSGFQGGGNGFLGRAILLDESVNILWSPSYADAANALYGYYISDGGFVLKHTFSQLDLGASSAVHQMAVFGGEVNAPPTREPAGLSGCDAGFGAAALASLAAAFVLMKRRRRG
jgi:hypothetical protein